jgi:serine/threonine-protein kinase HipA
MSRICLICGRKAGSDMKNYHKSCSRKMFGYDDPPQIPFKLKDLKELAAQIISERTAMTGVQKKLSLAISNESKESKLTIVGLWGNYILKPQVEQYSQLPENEFLTMCLAESFDIQTVPHALLPMASGEPAYVTRRIDRNINEKIPMEDMAQLLGKMTEEKYRSSVEQVGKMVLKYCENKMFDALRLYEVVLFSYLTGNSDMHLKNFSLIYSDQGITLAPSYDLLNTRLVISEREDPEESALSINGKRRKLKLSDFLQFATSMNLTERQVENVHKRFKKKSTQVPEMINDSLLDENQKQKYLDIFASRLPMIEE